MPRDRDPRDDNPTGSPKERLLREALAHFKLADEADAEQRRREIEDLKFDAGHQWPADVLESRKPHNSPAGVFVHGRPALVINKLDQPVQLTINQQRMARLSIKVNPKGDGADRETADVLAGLIRHIEVESGAQMARSWAFERAVKCGRGYYRVLKQYSNDGDDDQDLVISRILNQHSVYLDPHHQLPDGSDAEWCFVVEDLPYSRFKRLYPKSKLSTADEDDFRGYGDDAPGWVTGSGAGRTVRVAEYWYVEHSTRKRVRLDDGSWSFEDDVPEGRSAAEGDGARSRDIDVRTVKWCKLTAADILEEQDWDGRYIPIVQVLGKEYNINGERVYLGMISGAKDAQRSYNYFRSAQTEAIGLAKSAQWLVAEGQLENYERWWQSPENLPYLPYKPTALNGQPVPPPNRIIAEPAIEAITLAVREADNDIKATTGVFDPSLGNFSSGERSGKAISRLQEQGERGNSNYLDQLAQVSMVYEAKILLDLIPKVYDRAGRIARILGIDDEPKAVMLNQPFVRTPDGEPQPLPAGMPAPKQAEHYNLADGQYSVTVSVGKAFGTQRLEGAAMIGDLLAAAPALAPAISDLWVGQMDFPKAQEISDRLKKLLPPPLQEQAEGQPDLPPQVLQQMQQAQQMLDALTQQVNVLTDKLQSEEAKYQAQAAIKQMELESRERIAAMQVQAQLLETQAKIQTQEAIALVKAEIDRLKAEYSLVDHRESRVGQQIAETVTGGNGEARLE